MTLPVEGLWSFPVSSAGPEDDHVHSELSLGLSGSLPLDIGVKTVSPPAQVQGGLRTGLHSSPSGPLKAMELGVGGHVEGLGEGSAPLAPGRREQAVEVTWVT